MPDNIYKSYVYLFVMKNEIGFKIGKSDNPTQRFNILKHQYKFKNKFNIIECYDSTKAYELEGLLHKTFSKFNICVKNSTEFFEYDIYSNVCDLITNFTNHKLEYIDLSKKPKEILTFGLNNNTVLTFCEHIQKKRKLMGYTQQEFADIIGCSRVTLGIIERNINHKTSFHLYMRIADALKINVSFNDEFKNDN